MKYKTVIPFILVALIYSIIPARNANCAGRRISIGNKIPEFKVSDVSGNIFDYKHGNGKVLVVAFLSSKQKHSVRAAAEIKKIMDNLSDYEQSLSVIYAVDDPNDQTFIQPDPNTSEPNEPAVVIKLISDKEHNLWGKFGIIATPTVMISDTNDTVLWVEAGHGYDFAPMVSAHLKQALGIAQQIDPNEAGKVRTVTNATNAARVKRHLQMAKMLEEKGRIDAAITQLKLARELDPNSVQLALEIGELLCSIGQGKSALELLEGVKARGNIEKSELLVVTGWAKRQMNNLEEAEKLLIQATKLNPGSGRVYYELGQIYQAKGDIEKAMLTYYHALTLVFGKY